MIWSLSLYFPKVWSCTLLAAGAALQGQPHPALQPRGCPTAASALKEIPGDFHNILAARGSQRAPAGQQHYYTPEQCTLTKAAAKHELPFSHPNIQH